MKDLKNAAKKRAFKKGYRTGETSAGVYAGDGGEGQTMTRAAKIAALRVKAAELKKAAERAGSRRGIALETLKGAAKRLNYGLTAGTLAMYAPNVRIQKPAFKRKGNGNMDYYSAKKRAAARALRKTKRPC